MEHLDMDTIIMELIVNAGNARSLAIEAIRAAREGDYEKEFVVNRILVEQLLGELNEKERKLITLRYFEEKTQVQAAKELGVSQVQVSRLEKKILLRLRKRV